MTNEKMTPLRERMILRIRGMGDKAQKAHTKDFEAFSAIPGHGHTG